MGIDHFHGYPVADSEFLQLPGDSPGGNAVSRTVQEQKTALDSTVFNPLHSLFPQGARYVDPPNFSAFRVEI